MIPEDSRRGFPTIDCMFFPATHGDDIQLDPTLNKNKNINNQKTHSQSVSGLINNQQKYRERPTIIMCNPNALIY